MNNNISKAIGTRINSVLAIKNKHQKDLAHHLGVKDNVVSYWCSGVRTPNTEQIIEISKFLDVSADYLLGLVDVSTTDLETKRICNSIGLTYEAVETLQAGAKHQITDYLNEVINLSCNSYYGIKFYSSIWHYLKSNQLDVINGDTVDILDENFDSKNYEKIDSIGFSLEEPYRTNLSFQTLDKSFLENYFMMSVQNELSSLKRDLEGNQ